MLLLLLLLLLFARLANLPEVAGCEAKLRMEGDKPYVTDNSNYIVDLYFQVSLASAAGQQCCCSCTECCRLLFPVSALC